MALHSLPCPPKVVISHGPNKEIMEVVTPLLEALGIDCIDANKEMEVEYIGGKISKVFRHVDGAIIIYSADRRAGRGFRSSRNVDEELGRAKEIHEHSTIIVRDVRVPIPSNAGGLELVEWHKDKPHESLPLLVRSLTSAGLLANARAYTAEPNSVLALLADLFHATQGPARVVAREVVREWRVTLRKHALAESSSPTSIGVDSRATGKRKMSQILPETMLMKKSMVDIAVPLEGGPRSLARDLSTTYDRVPASGSVPRPELVDRLEIDEGWDQGRAEDRVAACIAGGFLLVDQNGHLSRGTSPRVNAR